jgi:transketolase
MAESPSSPAPSASPDLARRSIDAIRVLAMDAVERAKSGHPGAPMGQAPLAYALWTRILRYDAARPDWPDRDRFVLSCGHASMLLYAVLHLTGFGLELEDLRSFRQWGSKTPGHPEHGVTPGVEVTTGPLGQGLANAVGMALAERLLAARFNRPGHEVVDHRTWVLASDGDIMEGISHEAASLAGHLGLSRLCVFYDDNRVTIDGSTDLSMSEDVEGRFRALGWNVLSLGADATTADFVTVADHARRETDRPTLVIMRTHIAYGAPTKMDTSAAHGAPLGAEEVRRTKENLGWPQEPAFLVPEDVLAHYREAGRRGAADVEAWERRLAAYRDAYPEDAAEFERVLAGRLRDGWEGSLPDFERGSSLATRSASGKVLNALKDAIPELVGGSADLAGSNNTTLKGEMDVLPDRVEGRNIHFGVREHGMGAILNGLALHGGLRAYGGTFLVFSDYMRPAIRLAALMRLPVVYVFTHDSIGVGEDGPTHEPIEHLASLRAMPGLSVIRPADGAETREAWRLALEGDGPTALILSRQKLPELDHGEGDARGLRHGAYVLGPETVDPELSLLASGSEVHLAVEAARILQADGVRARVVSFPSFDRFEALDEGERESILGPGAVRVAIEAASPFGWHRWVGSTGRVVGMTRFGASAPGPRLMEAFGFRVEHVVAVAQEALARQAARSGRA